MTRAWLLIAVLISGCKEQPLACFVPPIDDAKTEWSKTSAAEWRYSAESCVDHYSRLLASSPDSPSVIAEAALHACDSLIDSAANRLVLEQSATNPDAAANKRELIENERGEALVEIEQYRAAGCKGAHADL